MFIVRSVLLLFLTWSAADAQSLTPLTSGRPAATFSLKQVAGPPVRGVRPGPVTEQSVAGRVVLLEVWWSTCPPCPPVHASVARLASTFADSGVVVLSLAIDKDSTSIVTWLASNGGAVLPTFAYPRSSTLGARATPTVILLDRQGGIAALLAGKAIQPSTLPSLLSALLHEPH